MKFVKLKIFLFGLFMLVSMTHIAGAAEEPWTDQFMREFKDLQTRMTTIEEQQKEILAKEDKILEELDRLRIWVHRR